MKLSKSIKLVMANFNLFWKVLVYAIFCVLICALFLLPVLNQLTDALKQSGFLDDLIKLFNGTAFEGVGMFMTTISNALVSFWIGLKMLAQQNIAVLIYCVAIIFIVLPFLIHLSEIAISECAYGYMSSLNKKSFVVSLLDKLGISSGYSILKTLIEIPFYLLVAYATYALSLNIAINSVTQIIIPLVWVVCIIVLLGLKTTLFSGWAQAIVTFNTCAGHGLKKGIKSVSRNFLSSLSSFAVVTTILLAVIVLFGAYALIPLFPLFLLITCVFGQVLFFESQGMDYYTSQDTVVRPRKLEQADSIRKVKFKI